MLCFQKTGAEIGEFLTPLIFLCHSYKKWTLDHPYEGIFADYGGPLFFEYLKLHCASESKIYVE